MQYYCVSSDKTGVSYSLQAKTREEAMKLVAANVTNIKSIDGLRCVMETRVHPPYDVIASSEGNAFTVVVR
jgi:hypothetical protein